MTIICSYNENHKHAPPLLAGVYASTNIIIILMKNYDIFAIIFG